MGEVVQMKAPMQLVCRSCGKTADASCTCGVEYVPASQRAAEAIKMNPTKSNRAIAEEIGVGFETVRRARKSGDPNGSPAVTIGKDGKKYPAKKKAPTAKKKAVKKSGGAYNSIREFEESPAAWRNRIEMATAQAEYAPLNTCPVNKPTLARVKKLVAAWTAVLRHIQKELDHAKSEA